MWYFLAVAFSNVDTVAAEECAESAAKVCNRPDVRVTAVAHMLSVQLIEKFGVAEGDPLPGQVAELLARMKAHNLAHPPPAAAGEEDEDEDEGAGDMTDM